MPFKKTADGVKDPKIYKGGRNWAREQYVDKPDRTFRDIGRTELLQLFKKIKPHSSKAVNVLANLMHNDKISEATRLKAAIVFLQEYRNLVKEVYDSDEELEQNEKAQGDGATVLHLRVVDKVLKPLEGDSGDNQGS